MPAPPDDTLACMGQPGGALVRYQSAEQHPIEALRRQTQAIAAQAARLDARIERRRAALLALEQRYNARLAQSQKRLARAQRLLRSLLRAVRLAERRANQTPPAATKVKPAATKVKPAPTTFLSKSPQLPHVASAEPAASAPRAKAVRAASARQNAPCDIKHIFRNLARRFHPDLGTEPGEHAWRCAQMARINELYRQHDVARLRMLEASHISVCWPAAEATPPGQRLDKARRRHQEMCHILAHLTEEWRALKGHPLHRLRLEVRRRSPCFARACARAAAELVAQRRAALRQFVGAARRLQTVVNHQPPKGHQVLPETPPVQVRKCDAHLLPALQTLAQQQPDAARLLMLAYLCERAAAPIAGLDSYAALQRCLRRASRRPKPINLARMLLQCDRAVSFGVMPQGAHLGLFFVDPAVRRAMFWALQAGAMRRCARQLLAALSRPQLCTGCGRRKAAIPALLLHGIDRLHALLCAGCACPMRRYRVLRGYDVALLLRRELVATHMLVEVALQVAPGGCLTVQMRPSEFCHMTVKGLLRRLQRDLIEPNGLQLLDTQLHIACQGQVLSSESRLVCLPRQALWVHCVGLDNLAAVLQARMAARYN